MNVLFVEDDDGIAKTVEAALRSRGHTCDIAHLGEQAIAFAKRNDYDIVVLDFRLPDMDGFHVIRRMKLEGIDTPVLLQSGVLGHELNSKDAALGVDEFLPKPFSVNELIERISAVTARSGKVEGTPDGCSERGTGILTEQDAQPDSESSQSRGSEHPGELAGEQQRRHARNAMIGAALIVGSNIKPIPCIIVDISESGAALRLTACDVDCPTLFTLDTLDTGHQWRCELRWRRGDKLGVEFT